MRVDHSDLDILTEFSQKAPALPPPAAPAAELPDISRGVHPSARPLLPPLRSAHQQGAGQPPLLPRGHLGQVQETHTTITET